MSDELNELDFTIEMNAEGVGPGLEADLFDIADARLRQLAGDKNDMIGAAVNIRQPAAGETPPLHEVTVVAYTRPDHVAATEKQRNVIGALKGALEAIERQVKQKRENLRERWEQPQNDPVAVQLAELEAAGEVTIEDEIEEELKEEERP